MSLQVCLHLMSFRSKYRWLARAQNALPLRAITMTELRMQSCDMVLKGVSLRVPKGLCVVPKTCQDKDDDKDARSMRQEPFIFIQQRPNSAVMRFKVSPILLMGLK